LGETWKSWAQRQTQVVSQGFAELHQKACAPEVHLHSAPLSWLARKEKIINPDSKKKKLNEPGKTTFSCKKIKPHIYLYCMQYKIKKKYNDKNLH